MFLLLTLTYYARFSIIDLEQVNGSWGVFTGTICYWKRKNGPENYYSFVEFCGQNAEMSTKLNMKIAKPLKNQ